MATTARSVFRRYISVNMGDYLTLTTTSTGSSTTVVCTALQDEDVGGDDDGFRGWWVIMTSGDASGEIRRVKRSSGYAQSSGTITVTRAFSATTGNAKTFEMHKYAPRIKHDALDEAVRKLAEAGIYNELVDETLVVDDRLTGSDMEGTITNNWTTSGTGTLTTETTRVKHGDQSAKLVGTTDFHIFNSPSIDVAEIAGRAATFAMWAWASVANKVRVRIDWDGSDFENSDFHEGDSSWRLIKATGTVPTTLTQTKTICQVADGATGYFDAGWFAIGALYKYTIPSTFIKGPQLVKQQRYEDQPDGPYRRFQGLIEGRRLQLRGEGAFTAMTTETSTIAVGEPVANAIAHLASGLAFYTLAADAASDDITRLRELGEFQLTLAATAFGQPNLKTSPLGAQGGRVWYIQSESGVKKLIIPKRRFTVNTDV